MTDSNFTYFQYKKEDNYQVFLRFEDAEFEEILTSVISKLGFSKLEREEVKNIKYIANKTKILQVGRASTILSRKIDEAEFSQSSYGFETLTNMGTYEVYKFRHIGMMILSQNKHVWELGIKETSNIEALYAIFGRYLSYALASEEVVGFWGISVDNGLVVMTPEKSSYEFVLIDTKKSLIHNFDKTKKMNPNFEIIRLNDAMLSGHKMMSREELFSYLSANTTYLSYMGFEIGIRDAVSKLAKNSLGCVLPESDFQPSQVHKEANL